MQDPYNGHSLYLLKDGEYGGVGIKDTNLFIHADFDELYEKLSNPQKTVTVDPKQLESYIKNQQQTPDQYQ